MMLAPASDDVGDDGGAEDVVNDDGDDGGEDSGSSDVDRVIGDGVDNDNHQVRSKVKAAKEETNQKIS